MEVERDNSYIGLFYLTEVASITIGAETSDQGADVIAQEICDILIDAGIAEPDELVYGRYGDKLYIHRKFFVVRQHLRSISYN